MRLITYNYAQLDETTLETSSVNPFFKASNIKHEHRAKEWRSSGRFEITALNNTIVINSVAHTVEVDSYSRHSLMNAINVLDDSVRASFDENTSLWTIETDEGTEIDGTLLSVLGFSGGFAGSMTAPVPAIHTSEWVVFDFKTTEEIDSFIILWGKGQCKITDSAVIRLQASATDVFDLPPVDVVLEIDERSKVASHYFETAQSYRFWRILISDPNNPSGYVSIGCVVAGLADALPDPDAGISFSQNDTSVKTKNAFGNDYVDKYPIMNELNINFSLLDYEISVLLMDIFEWVGTSTPIFITLDETNETFGKDTICIYGKLPASIDHNQLIYKLFSEQLTITEVN